MQKTSNKTYSRAAVDRLRKYYPEGTRIILGHMWEEDLPAGLQGTVEDVDDIGQIHVQWENGSSLALCPEVDSFRILI